MRAVKFILLTNNVADGKSGILDNFTKDANRNFGKLGPLFVQHYLDKAVLLLPHFGINHNRV